MTERAGIPTAWAELRHGGLLIAPAHVRTLFAVPPAALRLEPLEQLRRAGSRFDTEGHNAGSALLDAVLHRALGLGDPARPESGHWLRGQDVGSEWTKRSVTGEAVKPRRVWHGAHGATLPVFWSDEQRLGVGRGRRAATRVVEWLRQRCDRLALLTNGRQWRVVHASLDHEAWSESDRERWFEEGAEGLTLIALRALLSPQTLQPAAKGGTPPLLAAIEASRRSQAELSSELGERVRSAVERLIREHGEALAELQARDPAVTSREIYRAATRIVMRMVVVLFAEARDLLPRSEELYLGSYGLTSLREQLERAGAGGQSGSVRSERLKHRSGAWPRVLALFRLVHLGSGHPGLKVPRYGGELFEAGAPDASEALARAVHVFESAALVRGSTMPDLAVYDVLRLLTRSRVRVQAGRAGAWVEGPVDFGDLSSEYIGILYEGLLDYELRRAGAEEPVVFLAIGDEPALPLLRLETMEDSAIAELVKKAGKKRQLAIGGDDDGAEGDGDDGEDDEEQVQDEQQDEHEQQEEQEESENAAVPPSRSEEQPDDQREAARQRILSWARRAVVAGKLVAKPRSRKPEALREHAAEVEVAANGLIARFVLPGEWYLVRFGGTRKGSGTFYTRPQLAVPTVHRTLRPLAFDPPPGADGAPNEDAPPAEWVPKTPEVVLSLRVCDPACGSGSFPVAALRFLTRSLYTSLLHHGWIAERDGRLVPGAAAGARPGWLEECLHDALTHTDEGEELLERRLRRVVVERCLYGVDLDPLAVELAKLSLWVETLDRELPFTFLDHKIRCGNSLVGCWFDRMRDFPALAWDREGGDKTHTRGTHYQKEAWTKAIKAQRSRVKEDLARTLLRQARSAQEELGGILATGAAEAAHAEAERVFGRLHALPLHDSAERSRIFREAFRDDPVVRSLREAMDTWCAQWFWPADRAELAPLPSTAAVPSDEARKIGRELARELRFFHWELEFPDVFAAPGAGFDAVLGNPPWEIQKPSSKEYFSDLDPLYRAYGKQQALDQQEAIFAESQHDERAWLLYISRYKALSNFMKHAAAPFGDPEEGESFSLGTGGAGLHSAWRGRRARQSGFADAQHPYRHQGSADVNTYKLFLEQAHALLKPGGMMGFIVPSGLYTDKGSGDLRQLFLDRCRWRWLFGFENRDKVFDIDSRFKFGPVIVQKGGQTEVIRTAFMRRELRDWEDAERLALNYTASLVRRFSPQSTVILELPNDQGLDLLSRMYGEAELIREVAVRRHGGASSVRYIHHELFMTADSKLFGPREKWIERGFSPGPYGYWEDAGGNRAHPIVEGRMIGAMDFSAKGWVSGKGRAAVWRPINWDDKRLEPQFLIEDGIYRAKSEVWRGWKLTLMDVTSATNERTIFAAPTWGCVTVDSCRNLVIRGGDAPYTMATALLFNSFVFDFQARLRVGGLHVTWFQLEEMCLPTSISGHVDYMADHACRLACGHVRFGPAWLQWRNGRPSGALGDRPWRSLWAHSGHERVRLRAMSDAIAAMLYGLSGEDLAWILKDCDQPSELLAQRAFKRALDPKGFWRVDQHKHPELRHPVLSLVAFHDLERFVTAAGGDRDRGIEAFCSQNGGEGWMLPETLRLTDYGLGRDGRAKQAQSVRAALGERFLPWQLEQSVEESWAECHWHARNILGEHGYDRLQRQLRGEEVEDLPMVAEGAPPGYPGGQERLIPAEQPNLFGGEFEDLPKSRPRKPR